LEGASFADLDAMMEAYADAAVTIAREAFCQRLDYNAGSLVAFEAVLTTMRFGFGAATWVRCFGGAMPAAGR